MAASAQSRSQAPVVGGREDPRPPETVLLGVTEVALTVFRDFVDHIAANAENTVAVTEKLKGPTSNLRRSKRFATRVEAPPPCPLQLPAPLENEVRSPACVSCGNGILFRVCMAYTGIGSAVLHGRGSRPVGTQGPREAIITPLVDVQSSPCMFNMTS